MNDVFRAGVEPGGLTMDYEIKILICYLLRRMEQPFPVSALIEVLVEEGIANYFEAASAASALVNNGHLRVEKDENGEKRYRLTAIGEDASDTFEKDIPLSIRDKAVDAAKKWLEMQERRAHNRTSVRRVEDGYQLTLTITDIGSDLLSVSILLPDLDTCHRMQKRFLDDPVIVYKGVVALLTGSFESMGRLLD